MKIVDTDNFGRDYPDEKLIAADIKIKRFAELMCEALNVDAGDNASRYYKVVEDEYVLQPGFEP
jgi:hypothetical protein